MSRSVNEDNSTRSLAKAVYGLKEQLEDKSLNRITLRELEFARLLSCEGYSQRDAFIESFQPSPEAKTESIDSMASRYAKKPRIKAEIDRLKRLEADYALKRDERLAFAMNPISVIERMAVDLYVMATSSDNEMVRVKCWDKLGNMKHVDAFVRSSASEAPAGQSMNDFGIKSGSTSTEAKAQLVDSIKKLIGARVSTQTIELTKESENVGE